MDFRSRAFDDTAPLKAKLHQIRFYYIIVKFTLLLSENRIYMALGNSQRFERKIRTRAFLLSKPSKLQK